MSDDPWADVGSAPAQSGVEELTPSSPARPPVAPGVVPSERYGPGRVIGQGGMGRVESVDDRILGRTVARKSPKALAPEIVARLEREARITARLDHPGIVPVYDMGVGPTGMPWYTMRLIRGRSLEVVVQETGSVEGRMRLVPRVLATCQAVAYAHAHGVVHRDLKPSNIMVGPFGETLVVDWGLARDLESSDDGPLVTISPSISPELTRVGTVVGTPRWMSPEQAAGRPADSRSDVYALGRILAFVLGPDHRAPELAAVVGKATAEDPADRYPDAGELADELDAWLAGRRVGAYDYGARDLLWRTVQAWRAPLAVAAVAGAALVLLGALAFERTRAERDRALVAEREARQAEGEARAGQARLESLAAVRALKDGDSAGAARGAVSVLAHGDDPAARMVVAALLREGPVPQRTRSMPLPGCTQVSLHPDGDRVLCAGADASSVHGFPSGRILADGLPKGRVGWSHEGAVTLTEERVLTVHAAGGPVVTKVSSQNTSIPLPPRGAEAVLLNSSNLRLYTDEGTEVRHVCPGSSVVLTVAVRGRRWWAPCTAGTLLVGEGVDLVARRAMTVTGPSGEVTAVDRASAATALPDGTLLLGTLDGDLVRLDAETGVEIRRLEAPEMGSIHRIHASASASHALVLGNTGPARFLAIEEFGWTGAIPGTGWIEDAVWRDDETVIVARPDRLEAWSLEGETKLHAVAGPAGLSRLLWTDDSEGVWVGLGEGTVRLLGRSGIERRRLKVGSRPIRGLVPTRGGELQVGVLVPPVLRAIRENGTVVPVLEREFGTPRFLASLADGTLLFMRHSGVHIFSPDGVGTPIPGSESTFASTSSDRRSVLVGAGAAGVLLVSVDAPEPQALDPDGRKLVALSGDGATALTSQALDVEVFDVDTPDERSRWALSQRPTWVALDRAGELAFIGNIDGTIEARRTADGGLIGALALHSDRVSGLAVSPDDRLLASISWDKTTRFWDLRPLRQDPLPLAREVAGRWVAPLSSD